MVVQGNPARNARRLGEHELGAAGAHDRADLIQDLQAHGRGFQVRGPQCPTEVVQALERGETERESCVAPVRRNDQGADEKDRHRGPQVHPGRVEDDDRETDAGCRDHRVDQELGPGAPLGGGVAEQPHHDPDQHVHDDGEDAQGGDGRRPAPGADGTVRSQDLAEDHLRNGHAESPCSNVEAGLVRGLLHEEDDGSGDDGGQHEEGGRQEDQPEEQRHVLERDEIGVAAVVHRHGCPQHGRPHDGNHRAHCGLGDQDPNGSCSVERAADQEYDRDQRERRPVGVDRRDPDPAQPGGSGGGRLGARFDDVRHRGGDGRRGPDDGLHLRCLDFVRHWAHRFRVRTDDLDAVRGHSPCIGRT